MDAAFAGGQVNIHPGDMILRLGVCPGPQVGGRGFKILTSVNEAIPVEFDPRGQTLKTTITPIAKGPSRAGYVGWDPVAPGIIEGVEPNSPARKAGLKRGDEIVGINGHKVFTSHE